MYINNPYNYGQISSDSNVQAQLSKAPEMGTSFGYPMAPTPYPMQQPLQQIGGQAGVGQQIPQMPLQAQVPLTGAAPVDFDMLPTTPVLDIEYTQGYLKSQIGKRVKVEFLIGTNMLIDREGTLVDVGISYIIIREAETDDLILCDIYSIKFVKFYF
ncbi:MAG TPA: hypothetical protein PLL98_08690 [Bacillota bacterium]|nr:hypothetical protein [Bacillota bacterium]HOR86550.1 hypothetical protein [Bacillota bacterium]